MKTCSACRVSKPVTEFGSHVRMPDGLRSTCKECSRKPPRVAECARCGVVWDVRSRGQLPRLCPECERTHSWCHACQSAKQHAEFYAQRGTRTGRAHKCRECALLLAATEAGVRARKATAVQSRYGISLEEYEAHLLAADGVCPCCGKAGRKKMVIDHDHETGRIRGIICSACNSGIGLLGDSIEGLKKAIAYLEGVP